MKVDADFVCEHGMPQPWGSCVECMMLPISLRPERPEAPPSPPAVQARSPQAAPLTADDPLPRLRGDKDLSTPVQAVEPHVEGPDNSWLFAESIPRNLRCGGWVYLRHDGRLAARARVRGIGFRAERHHHTGEPVDAGPGATIEVDPESWERVDHDLGALADSQRQGYRYLITAADGSLVHLMASEPIPDDMEIDPPSV